MTAPSDMEGPECEDWPVGGLEGTLWVLYCSCAGFSGSVPNMEDMDMLLPGLL